jgi:ferredoxin
MDVSIKIKDREGVVHEVQAPTDMNMNIMELVRAYELAPEGTIGVCGGMAMCASCQCYVFLSFNHSNRSHFIPLAYNNVVHTRWIIRSNLFRTQF